MATTVTFKLNKDSTQFQAGESIGFGIRGGVKYYDRQTKQDAYTNFEAVIFAKQQRQIEFYQSALVAGSIVEVTGQKLAIKQFQGNNGLSLSIELLDASVGFIGTAGAPQAQGQQMQQQGYQQPQQHQQQNGYAQASGGMQRPQQPKQQRQPVYNEPPMDFSDDIPFAPIGLQYRSIFNCM
jgi:single-strand DNA-binding protein